MNYVGIYTALIERAKGRKIGGYSERHHIVPRCVGGSDDNENIAELTAREHYVAHQLLIKIYPGVPGLTYAAVLMSGRGVLGKHAGRAYEWVRRRYAEQKSAAQKGKQRPPEAMAAMRAAVKAMVKSEEHRRKIGDTLRGRKAPDHVREKLSRAQKGRKHSEQHRVNFSRARSLLTQEQMRAMRAEYLAGGVMDRISAKYGISKSSGARIMKGQSHTWIGGL
jgi:hypothetical protein